jgi:hypothetical protein
MHEARYQSAIPDQQTAAYLVTADRWSAYRARLFTSLHRGWRAALFNGPEIVKEIAFVDTEKARLRSALYFGCARGLVMLQLARFRLAVFALLAGAALLLTIPSARAFTQETLRAGGSGNSAFADSTNQCQDFGHGMQPFGPIGPVV